MIRGPAPLPGGIIMRGSIRSFGVRSGAAVVVLLTLASPSWAKRVICIDGAGGGLDPAINTKEGYERALGITAPPDIVSFGGIAACLGMVASGDELVVICHGGPGTFTFGGVTYTGFGGGAGQLPIPAGWPLMNVRIRFCSCFSANDPPGADTSVTSKILAAIGGAGAGNTAGGFQGTAGILPIPVLCGGTAAQRAAAAAALQNMLVMWASNPPSNRPGTGGAGQPANQQSAAQAKVDQVVGAGVIVVKIPNQVGQIGPPPVGGYIMPLDQVLVTASGVGGPICNGCVCFPPFEWVDGGDLAIPTVSEWGLIFMGIGFLVGGPFILRRIGMV